MNKILISLAGLSLLAVGAMAQEIKPVFLTTFNDDGSVLPILIKKGRTQGVDNAQSHFDGTRTSDSYFGLRRYDSSRLLLGVYSNGINESDPADNQTLAQQFPDRSLIWIDAGNGKSLGIALNLGFKPKEPTQAYLDANEGNPSIFLAFDVSEEGYIYVAYGEYILRYKPSGNTFTGPETVFQLTDFTTYGPEDWGTNTFSVEGQGVNTVITGGQNTNGFILTTADGNTFTLANTFASAAWPTISGPMSNIMISPDGTEEWIYHGGYGNASRGDDSTFYRLVRPVGDKTAPFVSDPDFFSAQGMPDAGDLEYRANYIGAIAGEDGLPWIVAYSTPSWNAEIKTSPGFITLHDVTASSTTGDKDGAYLSHIQIDTFTTDEPRAPGGLISDWFATQGSLEVNIPQGAPAGAAEIIWSGGIYGYGRFVVGDLPTSVTEWSVF